LAPQNSRQEAVTIDATTLFGRWFQLDLRPARRLIGWGPAWAAGCGALASSGLRPTAADVASLILVLFIADPLLGTIWDGIEALAAPAGAVSVPGQLSWRTRLHNRFTAPATIRLAVGLVLVVALAGLTGRDVLVVVAVGLVVAAAVAVVFGSQSVVWALARAGLEVGLAWSLGYVVFYPASLRPPAELALDWRALDTLRDSITVAWPATVSWLAPHAPALALATLFSLAYFNAWRVHAGASVRLGLSNLSLLAVAAVLVTVGQPLPATTVGVLTFGQAVFQTRRVASGSDWVLGRAQFYVMGCMLASAIGVSLVL
jgi:hypothetical protein